jgi:hypothetical protein
MRFPKGSEMTDERKDVAEELRRIREEVRRRAFSGEGSPSAAPPLRPVAEPSPIEPVPPVAPEPAPAAPALGPVNETWRAEPSPPRGLLFRLLDRLLQPRFEAQRSWNARQVQLDNDLVRYLDTRTDATHRHYDGVLGLYGRHLGEIDERHMILQEELVAHVEDLVRRIDLVLAETDRGRLASDFALEELRGRLERLEEALRRR